MTDNGTQFAIGSTMAHAIEIAVFGRNIRQVEVFFSDDELATVSRKVDGSYRALVVKASRSVGYSTDESTGEHAQSAINLARTYI